MASFSWKDSYACCNPFQKNPHQGTKKGMRFVSEWMHKKYPHISVGSRICSVCRLEISKISEPQESDNALDSSSDSLFCDVHVPASASPVNKWFGNIGKTPIKRKKMRSGKYRSKKLDEVIAAMEEVGIVEDRTKRSDCEMIDQLKEKFYSTESRSSKVQILTVLPSL